VGSFRFVGIQSRGWRPGRLSPALAPRRATRDANHPSRPRPLHRLDLTRPGHHNMGLIELPLESQEPLPDHHGDLANRVGRLGRSVVVHR
jgi:hypothetical protein